MRYAYPVVTEEASDRITVTCSDVPELVTEGDTRAEALERAVDALVTALSFYVDEGKPAPVPSSAKGRTVVAVPVMEAAKLALHEAMVAAGVSNVEMARRLGLDEKQVRRLRDPLRRSHIGSVETALRSLGRRLELSVMEAA
jgi:antitoxin HicB